MKGGPLYRLSSSREYLREAACPALILEVLIHACEAMHGAAAAARAVIRTENPQHV
jgi:hypothetical protein